MLKLIIFFILLQNQPDVKKPEVNKTTSENGKKDTTVSAKTETKERLILMEGFPSFDVLRITCKKTSSKIYDTVECKSIRALEEKYSECLRHEIKGCQFIKTTYEVFKYFEYYQKCKKDPGFSSDCKNITEDKYSDNINKLKKICNRRVFSINYTSECLSILKNKENYVLDCKDRTSIMYYLKFCKNYRYTKTYVERPPRQPAEIVEKKVENKAGDPIFENKQKPPVAKITEIPATSKRKFFFYGSFIYQLDDFDFDSDESAKTQTIGLTGSFGYFLNNNFALSLMISLQDSKTTYSVYDETTTEKQSLTMIGAGLLFYHENFYAGIQVGTGSSDSGSEDVDSISFQFLSFPVGVLIKVVKHVYFDIGLRYTKMFGDNNVKISSIQVGWTGFQIIF